MILISSWLTMPSFWLGLVLRFGAIYFFTQFAAETWYVPFFQATYGQTFFDPWQIWDQLGGASQGFPYGYAMWLVFYPVFALQQVFHWSGPEFYFYTLLIGELSVLMALSKLSDSNLRLPVYLFWLSPIVIIPTYVYGFNDIIPAAFLLAAILAIKFSCWQISGCLLAFAVSAKLSMLVALPIIILYFTNKASITPALFKLIVSFFVSLSILSLPFLISPAALYLLFQNPELAKLWSYAIPLGDVNLVLPPLAYTLFLYWVWRARRMSFEMFLSFLGIVFLSLALMTPQAPGWLVWGLPFLVVYQTKSNRIAIPLVQIFSAFFVTSVFVSNPIVFFDGSYIVLDNLISAFAFSKAFAELPKEVIGNGIGTLVFTIGALLGIRMWRESISQNSFFRLSRRPFMISVSGDSGAGKDTFANAMIGAFGEHSAMNLSGDDYHKYDRGKSMWQVMTHLNPAANNLEDFSSDIQRLRSNQSVYKRHYDHVTGKLSRPIKVLPKDFVVVSGLHAFRSAQLQKQFDVCIFLNINEDLRRHFKIRRDVVERGKDLDETISVIEQRKLDFFRHVEPQRARADLVFSLVPEADLPQDYGDVDIVFGMRVEFASGNNEDELIRLLTGVLSCVVQNDSVPEKGRVDLRISGELSKEEIDLAAKKLFPDMEEFLDPEPKWEPGMTGLMQVITLMIAFRSMSERGHHETAI